MRCTEFLCIFFGIPNFRIGLPICQLFNSGIQKKKIGPASPGSKTELEFRFCWGPQKSETKIGVPNQNSTSDPEPQNISQVVWV
jgi:hypothetical protein